MKLLYLITRGDSIGGAQIHVRDLSVRFREAGHQVTVGVGSTGPLQDALESSGVRVIVVPDLVRAASPRRDASAVGSVRELITTVEPDLVSTHSSKAGVIGRLAARREHVPCLFTAHGWAFTDGVPLHLRALYFCIEAAVAPLGSAIICVSQHDADLVERVPWMRARTTTIHNGVHDVHESLLARPEVAGPAHAVMVGRLDQQKDHATLFHALAQVPQLTIDLIGDGPGRAELESLSATLDLQDRVRFLGQCSDVEVHLARAHLFVLSSLWEGLPRSILEAMRAGLPVVASDVGGVAELVEDGQTGALVPRSDVVALASALNRYSDDAGLRAVHGAAGRRSYEASFTFERLAAQTEAMYRSVLG